MTCRLIFLLIYCCVIVYLLLCLLLEIKKYYIYIKSTRLDGAHRLVLFHSLDLISIPVESVRVAWPPHVTGHLRLRYYCGALLFGDGYHLAWTAGPCGVPMTKLTG